MEEKQTKYHSVEELLKSRWSVVLIYKDGHQIGSKWNYDKFKALPWYKKLWGQLNKNYRNKFRELEGFSAERLENIPTIENLPHRLEANDDSIQAKES